ncbi:uncharacterized protein LOC135924500 [Gordionus sp. m RMFG-2023]|uniref:uncharacterized protein LOC135924500 n=1 Tax=Gordionus sp. m RMFG-2023 TaxID=3053472 RepID=UPI0031FBB381
MKRSRSVKIKGQTLTIEGHNGEEDMMGRVTWLPVQELIRGWTDSDISRSLYIADKQDCNDNRALRPYREPKEYSRGRRMEIRQSLEPQRKGGMNCYNCGKPGHMLRDCRDTKCFGCGKFGHIAPYCPGKQERLRCAGCGRFGHNEEDCNVSSYSNKNGFTERGMGPNASNVRTIKREKVEGVRAINVKETGEMDMECFRCRGAGHVARDCENV